MDFAQAVLNALPEAVVAVDAGGRTLYLNAAAERLLACSSEDVVGRRLNDFLSVIHQGTRERVAEPVSYCPHRATVRDADEQVLIRGDGAEIAIEISVSPLQLDGFAGRAVLLRDVSRIRTMLREMHYLATHDALTQLFNRREFEQRLARVLKDMEDGDEHALLCMDLDRFKVVNDLCGHFAGDSLLRQVAKVFHSNVRARDTLARLGGDEFGLLLENCPPARALQAAHQLRTALEGHRFDWQRRTFHVGVSVGIVSLNGSYRTVSNLLCAADRACYAAKREGGNRVRVDAEPYRVASESSKPGLARHAGVGR